MIIYEFSTWGSNGKPYTIKEIEVEEKPKTYIARGIRVNKDDIGKLQSHFGNRMYRLDHTLKRCLTIKNILWSKQLKT